MEPQTQQFNTFNLLNFTPDTTLMYVNYFINHLVHKGNILYGAGAGTWNPISYFQNYATTAVDYLDYHLYPINYSCLNDEVFQIDSIAMANGKKIVVGECWLHKNSDSEYVYTNQLILEAQDDERDVLNYFEGVDTQFVQMMINLSQQANIELVNFFNTPSEFGYLAYGPPFDTMSAAMVTAIGTKLEYDNMFKMQLGPCGVFTRNAIAKINCSTDTTVNTGVKNPPPDIAVYIYPNPTSKQLTVICDQTLQGIDVYDVFGQNIKGITIDNISDNALIDVSGLISGVYFLKVQTTKGTLVNRFVKED
jgi:Secretion system C-terminal sorting domain